MGKYLNKNTLTAEERYEIESKTRNNPRAKFYTMNGKTQSIRAWCMELGISHNTVNERLKSGLSVEEAISGKKRTTGRKTNYVTLDGVTKPVKEWAEITGVPLYTYYYRKRCGWCDEDIFINRKNITNTDAFGKKLTAKKWAELTGINYATVCMAYRDGTLECLIKENLENSVNGVNVRELLKINGIDI